VSPDRPVQPDDLQPAPEPPDADGSNPLAQALPEGALAGPRVLSELLHQSHREAGASRAQARELVRAVTELRDAHEFLGAELLRERRRGRWLLAVLALAPVLAAAVVWALWLRIDSVRERHDDALAALDAAQDEERVKILEVAHGAHTAALEERVTGAQENLDAARYDLSAARDEARLSEEVLERDRRSFAEREREWLERIGRLERTGGEVVGLRAQLEALRDRSGAEAARADALERELRSRERVPVPVAPPPSTAPREAVSRAATPRVRPVVPPRAEAAGDSAAPPQFPSAVRSKDELERISSSLNGLLELTPGDALHRVTELGGVSGKELLEVVLEVRDRAGALIRTIEAPRAGVMVDTRRGTVLLTFLDGYLARGELRAPFFRGRYALVLDTDTGRWRRSGLTCVEYR